MPMSPRRIPVLAALTTGALLLAGCAGNPAADTEVDLTMAVWTSNEAHLTLFDEIADAYLADHPEVSSITFETVTNQDYVAGLTTQIAGGDVPDLAWVPEANAPEFVESGVLANLSPTFEATDGYDLADILPSARALWEQDGDLYAYPFSNSPFALYVNRDVLAAAGQPDVASLVGTDEYSWQTVTDIAAGVHSATGSTGLMIGSFSPTAWDNLTPLWAGWGARPWSTDGSTCTFTEPEMVDFLEWYQQQLDRGAMPPVTTTAQAPSFAAGDVAFSVAQLSQSGGLDGSFDWDFLPLPAGPEGTQPIIGQAGIGVVAKSPDTAAATEFLAYFTDAENSAKLATFFPPSRASLLNTETISAAAPALTDEQIQSAIVDVVPDATIKAASPVYSQITGLVRSALDPVWAGEDVSAATAKACDAIQPILEG